MINNLNIRRNFDIPTPAKMINPLLNMLMQAGSDPNLYKMLPQGNLNFLQPRDRDATTGFKRHSNVLLSHPLETESKKLKTEATDIKTILEENENGSLNTNSTFTAVTRPQPQESMGPSVQYLAHINQQIQIHARKLMEIQQYQKMVEFYKNKPLLPTLSTPVMPFMDTKIPSVTSKTEIQKQTSKPISSESPKLAQQSSKQKKKPVQKPHQAPQMTTSTSLLVKKEELPGSSVSTAMAKEDETCESEHSVSTNFEPVALPPLVELTKEFPDWDLGKIVEFVGLGKSKNEIQKRQLRGAKDYEFEELYTEKKEEEVDLNLNEEDKEKLVDELMEKLEGLLGFSDINRQKAQGILARKKFSNHKTLAFVKKNIIFYKKFFKSNKAESDISTPKDEINL